MPKILIQVFNSIDLCTMPVTTRSQAKLLRISTDSSENMSVSPVRLVWNCPSISSSTVENLDSLLTLPPSDFADLVKHHRKNNSISNGSHSEISKFQKLIYLTPPRVHSSVHHFETSQFHSMEADFNNTQLPRWHLQTTRRLLPK
jgi:hypothetical protein